jgi:hypothetical protein
VLDLVVVTSIADHQEIPVVGVGDNAVVEIGVPYDGQRLRALGTRFMMHFSRYLQGAGHPKSSIYDDLITVDDHNAADADPAFRARQFLSQMTGTSFLPLSEEPLRVSNHLFIPYCPIMLANR